jgi:SSS family transporter
MYKSRTQKNLDSYFLCNRSMPWYLVLLSIMGTQASAITFLSAPGQAFTDGMRFVQYYFGLPIAMVVLCITFVPLFNRLKVYTAYEFLEQRFNVQTRTFASFLFLLSRGLSTGISICAPSIILHSLLGWNLYCTNLFMGGLLIVYTVSGGAKAVAYTQQLQLIIVCTGMVIAGYFIVHLLPQHIGFSDALAISGASGKMNVITTGFTEKGFEWKDKYNIISGVIGGFFLALSYFGTDQSQVGRYLTAKDDKESKLSLLMNGLVKVPMQFLILLLGALLFTFYQFKPQPVFFNNVQQQQLLNSNKRDSALLLQQQYDAVNTQKQQALQQWKTDEPAARKALQQLNASGNAIRSAYKGLIKRQNGEDNDTNYVFLKFVIDYLPTGVIGLLIAVIFLAAWGSIAAALNSLASATVMDFHLRFNKNKNIDADKQYAISKYYTLAWGVFCMIVAQFASGIGSLIEAVNVLGSLFYGVMLGLFLVAFYCKKINGNSVLVAAIVSEILVIVLFILDHKNIIGLGFLWLNVVGALLVVLLSYVIQPLLPRKVTTLT